MSEELVNDEGQNSPYLRSAGAWSPLSESEASCQDRLANCAPPEGKIGAFDWWKKTRHRGL